MRRTGSPRPPAIALGSELSPVGVGRVLHQSAKPSSVQLQLNGGTKKTKSPVNHATPTRASVSRALTTRSALARTVPRELPPRSSGVMSYREPPRAARPSSAPAAHRTLARPFIEPTPYASEDLESMLERVIEYGDPTLTAATARLAQQKLESAATALLEAKVSTHSVCIDMQAHEPCTHNMCNGHAHV